jgi:hypothetical protein
MGDETTEKSDAAQKAAEVEDAYKKGEEKVKELEKDPPKNLEDWPDDHAKYVTFGGREGEHSYEEGPESKLGPSEVRHNEDGSVEVSGEKVDNPEEFKGDPIPGGPTDPNASGDGGDSETADQPDDATRNEEKD